MLREFSLDVGTSADESLTHMDLLTDLFGREIVPGQQNLDPRVLKLDQWKNSSEQHDFVMTCGCLA